VALRQPLGLWPRDNLQEAIAGKLTSKTASVVPASAVLLMRRDPASCILICGCGTSNAVKLMREFPPID